MAPWTAATAVPRTGASPSSSPASSLDGVTEPGDGPPRGVLIAAITVAVSVAWRCVGPCRAVGNASGPWMFRLTEVRVIVWMSRDAAGLTTPRVPYRTGLPRAPSKTSHCHRRWNRCDWARKPDIEMDSPRLLSAPLTPLRGERSYLF
ncbi:hypothetical protein GGC64_005826 [Mycobacterium sp. OAS707]|nr:hypothetical protein [Mycobacterium sp. OAS707]